MAVQFLRNPYRVCQRPQWLVFLGHCQRNWDERNWRCRSANLRWSSLSFFKSFSWKTFPKILWEVFTGKKAFIKKFFQKWQIYSLWRPKREINGHESFSFYPYLNMEAKLCTFLGLAVSCLKLCAWVRKVLKKLEIKLTLECEEIVRSPENIR